MEIRNGEFDNFNRDMIFQGSQIKTFNAMCKSYFLGFNDLDFLKRNGKLVALIIASDSEASKAMEEIKQEEMKKFESQKSKREKYPTYNDYCPDSWATGDPDVNNRIYKYKQFLTNVIKRVNKKNR